ncbi:MAG: tetratricopeptide repeat protein [Elusimicrobiota bacterium]
MKITEFITCMKIVLSILLISLSACASTGKSSIIADTGDQKILNQYLSSGIENYRKNRLMEASIQFNKFFAEMKINARVEFDEIIDREDYKKQIVNEYINRIEPELISRQGNIQSLFTQGMFLFNAGQYRNSIEFFVKVLVLDHRHSEAIKYINLANIEITRIEKEKKIEEERCRKEEARERVEEYYKNGMEFYKNRSPERARSEFEKVMEIDPEYKKTKDYYDKISARLFDKAKNYYKEGLSLYSAGDIKKAISIWEEALELAPSYREVQKALERARAQISK